MNRAKPTKKATPTSKQEGDKPIVEAVRVLVNGNADASAICRRFLCSTPALGSSWVTELDTSGPGPTTNQNLGAAVRKLVITQNMTLDG
jgi:hypothetical protein